MNSFADDRATVAALLEDNAGITADDVHAEPSDRPGWTMWTTSGGMWVHLPTMLPDAPADARARYWLRIHSGLTGECVMCGQVADITARPGSAAFLLPVTVALIHLPACPALFADDEAYLFDPVAWEAER